MHQQRKSLVSETSIFCLKRKGYTVGRKQQFKPKF